MEKVLLYMILAIPALSGAMEISCYSSTKLIYHGYTKDVYYNDNFLVFYDKKQNKSIYIRAECVIKNNLVE